MSKLLLVVAAGAGYVLGARAGRKRYEQIAAHAQRLWADPRMQRMTGQVTETVRATAPAAKDQLTGAAKRVVGTVRANVGNTGRTASDG